jgi:hypothetical protein
MDDRTDYVAQRDSLDAAGQDAWNASTRSGENLQAKQPSDVIGLGAASVDPYGMADANERDPVSDATDSAASSKPPIRYIKAAPGDSISRLVGTSDPGAIGRFLRLNGMDGRSSNIFAGRVYALPAEGVDPSSEEIAAGRQVISQDNANLRSRPAWRAANDQFSARLNDGLNVWTSRDPYTALSPPTALRPHLGWADHSAPLKAAAGTAAFVAGLPYGFMRGGIHLGQDIGNAVDFGMRLADPNDAANHPLDEPAREVLKDTGRKVVSYGKSVVADPRIAVRDAGDVLRKANVSLNPFASPMAPTLSEEMKRDFGIGANVGELGFQVPLALEAGGELAALNAAKPLSQGDKIGKLLSEGFDQSTAIHLAAPNEGMGSHYVPRRTRIPALSPQPLPKWLMDSPFNVSKPAGMSRDEFYRYHYAVDPNFYGAKLPAGMKGLNGHPGWRASDLGLRKYGAVGRAWYGAPAALKEAVAGASLSPGLAAVDFGSGGQ